MAELDYCPRCGAKVEIHQYACPDCGLERDEQHHWTGIWEEDSDESCQEEPYATGE